jgi:hypothetical protein
MVQQNKAAGSRRNYHVGLTGHRTDGPGKQEFDWINECSKAGEIYERSHEFAEEAVNLSMVFVRGTFPLQSKCFPKYAPTRKHYIPHAADLLADAIMEIGRQS